MITQATLRIRPGYERAGEYRRPSIWRRPFTDAERTAAREACNVPRHRWGEADLQQLPEPPIPITRAVRRKSEEPAQLHDQPRPATLAAPPAVLSPVPAEDNPAPSVPRAVLPRRKPMLSDLARATLERFRARYAL